MMIKKPLFSFEDATDIGPVRGFSLTEVRLTQDYIINLDQQSKQDCLLLLCSVTDMTGASWPETERCSKGQLWRA